MNRISLGWLCIIAALTLAACARKEEAIQPVDASAYKTDLETLSGARVFFGHQSVGRYLLQGVADLSKSDDSPLRIVRVDNVDHPDEDTLAGLFHTDIGANSNPFGKIDAFSRFLLQPGQPAFDIALLKFCYVDLGGDGVKDPHDLLEQYANSVAELRAVQPRLRLVHVTAPLRADPPGRRTAVKRLLHLSTEEDADNVVRNAYNQELRKRFAGEPIFDIAEVESTLPDGTRSYFMHNGERIYTLANVYTDDGGHPNAIGRQYVAAAFVRAVAQELRKGT
jgi:hypothetical protein